MASSSPPGPTSGIAQPSRRSSGASALAVTTSKTWRPCSSSARLRTTSTFDSARSSTTSSRNVVRRSNGSTRVMWQSGRTSARTRPGSPAPEPRSTTVAPSGIRAASPAQLRRCRSQSRGASRGPISPRSTPGPASSSAYRWARSKPSPKAPRASAGAGGSGRSGTLTCGLVSRETWSRRKDHHEAARSHALRLRGEAGSGHLVVDDLALERRHGLERHRLARLLDLGNLLVCQLDELVAPLRAVAGDVQHEAGPVAGLPEDREASQLLQSLEHLAVATDQLLQVRADDRHRGAIAIDIHVEVSVEVRDVEQLLQVISRDVALALEVRQGRLLVHLVGEVLRSVSGGLFSHRSSLLDRGGAAVDGRGASALPAALALLAGLLLRLLARCAGGLFGDDGGLSLFGRRHTDSLAGGLGRVALALGLLRRRPGGRVVPDHVELLAHRPEVGGGPVQEHADRERDATDGEDQREDVEQDLLLLGVGTGERVGRHVLAHQLTLGRERRDCHGDHPCAALLSRRNSARKIGI